MLILRRLQSTKSVSKYIKRSKINPGIGKQDKLLRTNMDDFDDFESTESDFMSLHKTHREHVEQMETWKEKEKYLIIKQKYFKENFPNFLTWHDKEQIRYLHNSDPEEWSIEKLSEGFPAMPDIIEKIVRSKWTKNTQNKVLNHDRAVIKNWKYFKNGKLENLPEELQEHLKKFTDRSLNLKPFVKPEDEDTIVTNKYQKISGEFSEIISSYQKLKDEKNNDSERNGLEINGDKEKIHNKKLASKKKNPKNQTLLTFKELQTNIETDLARGKSITLDEKLILKEVSNIKDLNSTVELQSEEISQIVLTKHQTIGTVGFVRKTADVSHLVYPEKIVIPKKYLKEGYTYKLNDCYYDYDGEFLYRVPGMG